MPGLQLGFNAGLFSPPVSAALPPSQAGTARGAQLSSGAYGLASADGGRATAGIGGLAVGIASAVILVGLWWTLPR